MNLQEPLRKIQMFISLITENANDDFSSKNQKYFDKIKNAAQRMQALIINLLKATHALKASTKILKR